MTVSAGIDHTTNSTRPSYDSSRLRVARGFDDRYHQANAKVATITGTTTTSMIAVELMRRSRSAEAIGPCGSNTPAGLQEARRMVAPTAGQRSKLKRRAPCSKVVFLTGRLNMQITRPEVGTCHHKSALPIILRSEAVRKIRNRRRTCPFALGFASMSSRIQ